MTNHFRNMLDAKPGAGALAQPQLHLPQRSMPSGPKGWLAKWQVRGLEDSAALEQKKAQLATRTAENIATVCLSEQLQGLNHRTSLAAMFAEQLSASIAAHSDSHTAAVTTQMQARGAALLTNLIEKNNQIHEIKAYCAAGEITQEDAKAAIATIIDTFLSSEDRISNFHDEVVATTDRVYKSGFKQIDLK